VHSGNVLDDGERLRERHAVDLDQWHLTEQQLQRKARMSGASKQEQGRVRYLARGTQTIEVVLGLEEGLAPRQASGSHDEANRLSATAAIHVGEHDRRRHVQQEERAGEACNVVRDGEQASE